MYTCAWVVTQIFWMLRQHLLVAYGILAHLTLRTFILGMWESLQCVECLCVLHCMLQTCYLLFPLSHRSYLTPVRDEEAESLRKARSRQARQTRRSTQVSMTPPHPSVLLSFCLSSFYSSYFIIVATMSKAIRYRIKFIAVSTHSHLRSPRLKTNHSSFA